MKTCFAHAQTVAALTIPQQNFNAHWCADQWSSTFCLVNLKLKKSDHAYNAQDKKTATEISIMIKHSKMNVERADVYVFNP